MTARSAPLRTGLFLGGGGSLLALLPAALSGSLPAMVLGGVGFLLVTLGTSRLSESAINTGAASLYGTVLVAGMAGISALGLVAGTLGAVIAWDSARRAVAIQQQVPGALSRRTQLLGATVTAAVVVLAGIVSILSSLVVTSRGSAAVMVVLLVGVLALLAGLTR